MDKQNSSPTKVDSMYAKIIATICSFFALILAAIILSQLTNNGYIVIPISLAVAVALWFSTFKISTGSATEEKLRESEKTHALRDEQAFYDKANCLCKNKTIAAKIIASTFPDVFDGDDVVIGHDNDSIHIGNIKARGFTSIECSEILEINISGPGTVTSNAGITGGGFGLEGFVKGALVAAAINTLTTKKTTITLMQIISKQGEIHIHASTIEPLNLRMMFSTIIANIFASRGNSNISQISSSEEIERMHKLLNSGILSQDEFDEAKRKIIQRI